MEKTTKIAYLGPEKSYTETAAKELFPNKELYPLMHIKKVIIAVENEEADLGVIPLENFINGKVSHTLDGLRKYALRASIIGEKRCKIDHCFGALSNHKEIEVIYSKDQALEQCDDFLTEKYPNAHLVEVPSTPAAAIRVFSEKLLNAGVIASEGALRNNGLEVLAKDICPNNYTRFIALGREPTKSTGNDKTFLAIHPKIDKPGTLYGFLAFPTLFGVNLEDLMSRPDRAGGYYFYMEMEGHILDEKVKKALENIKYFLDPQNKYPNTVKIFGSYPNTHWKEKK